MLKKFVWTLALSVFSLSVVSSEEIPYGLTLRDTKEKFTIFTEGSVADDIQVSEDGMVSWVATARKGAGGGVAFYVKSTKEEINIGNYESVDLELDYSIVEGLWNETAMNPGFAMRILPWDSTGLFGGFEELEYFETDAPSGTLYHHIDIPSDFVDRLLTSSDMDSVLGFAIKFNDYERGNTTGDQLKVTLKNVTFNAKEGAAEDQAFDDGLTESQRGSVVEIYYPSRDYTVEASALTDLDRYEKHGWVYLPAGYDATDVNTKYPLLILLHGGGQNENTWGLTNKGRGGKIKGYMDRGMASGEVEKFILVVVTGIASKLWGPNGGGRDRAGCNAFGSEVRGDLLPYMRANFKVKEGRDYIGMAGLSMGGGQTVSIGVQECLDLISHFGTFSIKGAHKECMDSSNNNNEAPDNIGFIHEMDAKPEFQGLKIHNYYAICGSQDPLCNAFFSDYVEDMSKWDRIENFESYVYPGGTHDFPVWYKGFNDFIHMVFKSKETEPPVTKKHTVVKKITKCRVKKY